MTICPVTPVIGAGAVLGAAGAATAAPRGLRRPSPGRPSARGQCGSVISSGRTYAAASQAQGDSATAATACDQRRDHLNSWPQHQCSHTYTMK